MIDVINDIRDITSETMPKNTVIVTNYIKAWKKINSDKYKKIMVSISGGSDSDIVLDVCYRCDKDNKCSYVWFDTGLEYQATKEHLEYLEKKYEIDIIRQKAVKPIPLCCKSYGQPFLSKYVSEMIERLQRNKFDFKYVWKYEDAYFKIGLVDKAFQVINDGQKANVYYRVYNAPLFIETSIGIAAVLPMYYTESPSKNHIIVKRKRNG